VRSRRSARAHLVRTLKRTEPEAQAEQQVGARRVPEGEDRLPVSFDRDRIGPHQRAEEEVDGLHGLAARRPRQERAGDGVRAGTGSGFEELSLIVSARSEDDEQPTEHVVARRRQARSQSGEGGDGGS
jgi:hypothetical protein